MKTYFSILLFSVLLFAVPASVHAAKGSSVTFAVTVVDYATEPAKIIKGTFVAMYRVKLVKVKGNDDVDVFDYVATQLAIKPTGSKGTAAKFVVKPNEVVYFLGFKSKKDALKVKKFTPESPPIKNFTKLDGKKGQLCMTDGTDFSKKFQFDDPDSFGGQKWCYKSLGVEIYNPLPADVVIKNSESDVLMGVDVVDASSEPAIILANKFVAMYSVGLLKMSGFDDVYQYDGVQVAVKPTGNDGKGAKFLVKQGEVVYFLGFSSAAAAAEYKKYEPETPPLKNFDGGLGQLCRTDGTDFSKKFQFDDPDSFGGQKWCYKNWTVDVLK